MSERCALSRRGSRCTASSAAATARGAVAGRRGGLAGELERAHQHGAEPGAHVVDPAPVVAGEDGGAHPVGGLGRQVEGVRRVAGQRAAGGGQRVVGQVEVDGDGDVRREHQLVAGVAGHDRLAPAADSGGQHGAHPAHVGAQRGGPRPWLAVGPHDVGQPLAGHGRRVVERERGQHDTRRAGEHAPPRRVPGVDRHITGERDLDSHTPPSLVPPRHAAGSSLPPAGNTLDGDPIQHRPLPFAQRLRGAAHAVPTEQPARCPGAAAHRVA
jgi:hypothetical protein